MRSIHNTPHWYDIAKQRKSAANRPLNRIRYLSRLAQRGIIVKPSFSRFTHYSVNQEAVKLAVQHWAKYFKAA